VRSLDNAAAAVILSKTIRKILICYSVLLTLSSLMTKLSLLIYKNILCYLLTRLVSRRANVFLQYILWLDEPWLTELLGELTASKYYQLHNRAQCLL
jgi:hypothetical protein